MLVSRGCRRREVEHVVEFSGFCFGDHVLDTGIESIGKVRREGIPHLLDDMRECSTWGWFSLLPLAHPTAVETL
jgi:hypothetical protein